MEAFEKHFEQRTIDGICAVVFLPANSNFDELAKEEYIFIYLYDAYPNKTKCWFCIRRDAVPVRGKVTLKVPEYMVGRVIGMGGMNIKKVAKNLGGRYVTVQKV